MRRFLCVLAMPLLTCGAPGPEGPPGPQGAMGPAGAMGAPGVPGKDGTSKVPHLILADTGEDLGILLSIDGIAYSETLGGPVLYVSNVAPTYFAEADCKGASVARFGPTPTFRNMLQRGPKQTWLRKTGQPQPFSYKSIRVEGGDCGNTADQEESGSPYVDTGIPARAYDTEELAIELR